MAEKETVESLAAAITTWIPAEAADDEQVAGDDDHHVRRAAGINTCRVGYDRTEHSRQIRFLKKADRQKAPRADVRLSWLIRNERISPVLRAQRREQSAARQSMTSQSSIIPK